LAHRERQRIRLAGGANRDERRERRIADEVDVEFRRRRLLEAAVMDASVPNATRRPIGSSPGKTRAANVSFTTATSSPPPPSSSVNTRPRRTGICIAPK
jgi:hypothetical protein